MLGLLFIGLVIVILAAAFAWPWVPPRAPTFAERYRFAPVKHGNGRLYARHDASGSVNGWISENVSAMPAMIVLGGDVPQEIRDSLLAVIPNMYDLGQYPPGVELFRVRGRTWSPGTAADVLDTYVLRDASGDYLLGLVNPAENTIINYTPPLPQLPADLTPGSTLTQTGTVVAQFPYTVVISIQQSTHLDGLDCREIESQQSIVLPEGDPVVDHVVAAICEGMGAVAATSYVDGEPDQRLTAVYSSTLQTNLAPTLDPLPEIHPPTIPDAGWTITEFAQAEAWFPGPATTPPVYLPGDPPAILVASRGGILSAISTQEPQTILWTWQAGGDIYSTPAVDLASGRIYFGSIDRRLTALTANGLYLWQHRVGDNIAASPLLVDDLVIVPSEDATLYAFDAASGVVRWSQPLDSSSVARPALIDTELGKLILSATDTGVVAAHHAENGALAWSTEIESGVAAGLLAAQDLAVVSQRDGTLVALNPATGDERWTTSIGWPIRFTPVRRQESIYLHNENGDLLALDWTTGHIRWQNSTVWHVGAPVLLDSATEPNTHYILSGVSDGSVALYATDGSQVQLWTNAQTTGSATTSFTFGAVPGDGAYWLVDSNGVLWRLGPPPTTTSGDSS